MRFADRDPDERRPLDIPVLFIDVADRLAREADATTVMLELVYVIETLTVWREDAPQGPIGPSELVGTDCRNPA
jgi:hypothetical protein